MKKVYIIHGWAGSPKEHMLKWLKQTLEKKGFEIYTPVMPDAEKPEINLWVSHLNKIVKSPDENTYFIGHSVGCQTIMRYLETLPNNVKVGGAIFIAGWFDLINLETKEEEEITKPWIDNNIDFIKVKSKTDNIIAVFSDNDPFVPLNISVEKFRRYLGAKIIIEKNKGHFTEGDGVKEIPVVLNEILRIAES